MSNSDAFAMVICGAGLSSIFWSLLAWRETYHWMTLVDCCLSAMEQMRNEIDVLKASLAGCDAEKVNEVLYHNVMLTNPPPPEPDITRTC